MSGISLGLRSDETLLWESKPNYHPRRYGAIFATIAFLFVAISLSGIYGGLKYYQSGLTIPTLLLIPNLLLLYEMRGTHYYITNRRILKKRPSLLIRRDQEIPIEFVTEMVAKRMYGGGLVKFGASAGRTVIFRMLKEDPDNVRRIVLDAKRTLAH